ncbi:cilia- and flagella-associated protein 251 isoform X2 [Lampris incognitus]|uniref:cilia- and flagella-associated protein 251 isoform X2 n=1 Tax=Lampris incognitus TaxID=2546036 RepID=UPI0024B51086|nr:cilia- and flagella-associated protein 251 isoform X2 [Lampris incognitus]
MFSGAVTERARSLRQWVSSTDSTDDNWEVTMTTTYDSEEHDHVNSVMGNLMETTVSSTASSPPPTKPKRSFRHKQELQPETAEVYLERCDPAEEEEERGADKERETSSDSLSGENGSSDDQQLSTGTDKEREENEGRTGHSWEENGGLREEEEKVEGMKVAGKASQQGREERKVEEVGEDSVEREVEEVGRRREAAEEPEGESRSSGEDNRSRSSADAGDDDGSDGGGGSEDKHERENSITGSDEQEEGSSPNSSSTPCPARRSRVIRLYQYDEDGQRYSHLPNPAPDKSAPAPRLKQRSLSLTRLNAIIAAASAGPLDTTGREAEEERDSLSSPTSPSGAAVFHLEI